MPVPATSRDVQRSVEAAAATGDDFCCTGCEVVFHALLDAGLSRFYDLGGGKGVPAPAASGPRSTSWLEEVKAKAARGSGELAAIDVDIQGMHCAACVWLVTELFKREAGGVAINVNPSLGKLHLSVRRDAFDLDHFVAEVERFGYLLGPSRKAESAATSDIVLRLGVSVACSMNIMIFSIAFYVGLSPAERETFDLFTALSLGLATIVVFVGGWPFFRAAVAGLRARILTLDLPIALGIALSYAMTLVQATEGRGDIFFVDTLSVFVTLMLVGRWLSRRVLDRNRQLLLEDRGVEGLSVRRIEGSRVVPVSADRLRAGDDFIVAPGDVCPVDAKLAERASLFSREWVNGEPHPALVSPGDVVAAGSINAGSVAAVLSAQMSFSESPLPRLFCAASSASEDGGAESRLVAFLVRRYVVLVLTFAAVGFLAWAAVSFARAVDVTVAVLIVTCPCALGIALPLARDVVVARLRAAGIFVRRSGVLSRLAEVRRVLFDKTGTLTLGRLEIADRDVVGRLAPTLRDAAYDMAARSNHPVSRALAEALLDVGARFDGAASVTEEAGAGLEMVRAGVTYRLGSAAWAGAGAEEEKSNHGGTKTRRSEEKKSSNRKEAVADAGADAGADAEPVAVLTADGVAVATFAFRERVRPDAVTEIAALRAGGFDVWLVSGDSEPRVAALARELGLPTDRARADQRPDRKAALVAEIDAADTLFVGDGLNDSLAFARALVTGTPAVDRPVMPGKADFFWLGEGIAAVRTALRVARQHRFTVRRIVTFAVAYNLLAIGASLAGIVTPLVAALAMPASSIIAVLLATGAISAREPATKRAIASSFVGKYSSLCFCALCLCVSVVAFSAMRAPT